MSNEINYKSNPLHGLSLKKLITELAEYYGYDILYAYLNINCFKERPSIESSVKFLKKTEWAREKVEAFYLYQYKSLPRASAEQFELPPRDRVIPEGQTPGEPAELSIEDAENLREKRGRKALEFDREKRRGGRKVSALVYDRENRPKAVREKNSSRDAPPKSPAIDPWGKWFKKNH